MKDKKRINQLGYDAKTKEYVYIHEGKEMWREKGDRSLLDHVCGTVFLDHDKMMAEYPSYKRYSEDCDKYAKAAFEQWRRSRLG